MPEWFLVILALALASLLGLLWRPLLVAGPLLVRRGRRRRRAGRTERLPATRFADVPRTRAESWKLRSLTALLHLLQPLARLIGRRRHGLTPWRRTRDTALAVPRPRSATVWTERWLEPAAWLEAVEVGVAAGWRRRPPRWGVRPVGPLLPGGLLGTSRLVLAVEEHGSGRQLARFRWWPRCSWWALAVPALLGTLAMLAFDESQVVGMVLGLGALAYGLRLLAECAAATAAFHAATASSAHATNGRIRSSLTSRGRTSQPKQRIR